VLDDSIAPFRFWGWREAHCLGASGAIRPKRPLAKQLPCNIPYKPSRTSTSIVTNVTNVTNVTLAVFTSMWFVHNISLCFSAVCAIHNHQLLKERSTVKYPKVLGTCLYPMPHFNANDNISSVLIPNADTKISEIQSGMQAVRQLHVQSCCQNKPAGGDGAWASAQIHEAGISNLAWSHQAVVPSSRREGSSSRSPSLAACTWSNSHTWAHGSSCL
jgi:hypothetical protein